MTTCSRLQQCKTSWEADGRIPKHPDQRNLKHLILRGLKPGNRTTLGPQCPKYLGTGGKSSLWWWGPKWGESRTFLKKMKPPSSSSSHSTGELPPTGPGRGPTGNRVCLKGTPSFLTPATASGQVWIWEHSKVYTLRVEKHSPLPTLHSKLAKSRG